MRGPPRLKKEGKGIRVKSKIHPKAFGPFGDDFKLADRSNIKSSLLHPLKIFT
jgi:hypothetical protein